MGDKIFLTLLSIILLTSLSSAVLINEFVTDQKTDWDGSGSATSSDEWVELYNPLNESIDLTNWTLILRDTNNETEELSGTIAPLEYKIILNPAGTQSNDGKLELYNELNQLVDSVTYGDYDDDGNESNNAPDADADSPNDECLARIPNGQDTNQDNLDFIKTACTYGFENSILEENEQGLRATILGKIILEITPRWIDFGSVMPNTNDNPALSENITFDATGSEEDINIEITEVIGEIFHEGLKIDGNSATDFSLSLPTTEQIKTAVPTLNVPKNAEPGPVQGTIVYTISGQTP